MEAWDFLSDPENLKTITPEHMGFTILHPINKPMYPGQIIQYRVSPFPFLKMRWVTEITHVKEGEYFVDEQRFGPYKLWHHKHFIQVVKGGVSMEDIVDFKLPFGIFGRIAYELLIRNQLYNIFKFREQKLTQLFGTLEEAPQKLTFRTI
jgi:ligand-binding SRPBCC domain-containing protein